MTIKNLIWNGVENMGYMSQTNVGSYFIWIDREKGFTSAFYGDRKQYHHKSLDDAKIYCQKDFENRITENIIL